MGKKEHLGGTVPQRVANIAGEKVVLSCLGPPLEPLFERFYTSYFAGLSLPWEQLDTAAQEYFSQHHASFEAHNAYFNNFISLWQRMMVAQLYVDAERVWEQALQPALAWNKPTPASACTKAHPTTSGR